MIAVQARRLAVYLVLAFALVTVALGWWQVVDAPTLAARPDNPEVIEARRSMPRGSIFDVRGEVLASSQVVDGLSRRTYPDPAFTHLIGFASLRFGTTGLERVWDDILIGQTDPNPVNDIVDDVLGREPQPRDLTLTVDQRLQDFAAAQLEPDVGAVVAIDPRTGAVLAMTSTPTFNATPISGDPAIAGPAMNQIRNQPGNPLVARDRQGRYTPGSIMKIVTAAAGLETGAITPQTTFPDQPRQEVEGFVVDGFRVLEHDLSPVRPALWALSEALQVSSNIFFAHVGLEVGPEEYLDQARAFGFCAGLAIGDAGPPAAGGGVLRDDAGGRRLLAVHRSRRAGPGLVRAGTRQRDPGADGAGGGDDRERRPDAHPVRGARRPGACQSTGSRPERPGARDADAARRHAGGQLRDGLPGALRHGRCGRGSAGSPLRGRGRGEQLRGPRRADRGQDRHRRAGAGAGAALLVHRLRAGAGLGHAGHRGGGDRRGRRLRLGSGGARRRGGHGRVAEDPGRRLTAPDRLSERLED